MYRIENLFHALCVLPHIVTSSITFISFPELIAILNVRWVGFFFGGGGVLDRYFICFPFIHYLAYVLKRFQGVRITSTSNSN